MKSERISYMTYKDNVDQDEFHSVLDLQQNIQSRPTLYIRPKQIHRNTLQLGSIQESSMEPLLNSETQLSKLVPRKRQVVPIGQVKRNRVETLLLRSRPQRQKSQLECSLDTSAALIKLINKNRWIRYLMNLYIWLNIGLRIGYVAIVIFL